MANLKSIPVKTPEFEAALNRHVSALLKIPPTEDFDFQVHYAFLDRDTLLDAVVLVNRAAYAQEKAKKKITKIFSDTSATQGLITMFLSIKGNRVKY